MSMTKRQNNLCTFNYQTKHKRISMPKFVITERIPTYKTWTYEVEAETEQDALEMVLHCDIAASDITTDEPDYTLAEYEIVDENGDVYDVEKDEDDDYDGAAWDMQAR